MGDTSRHLADRGKAVFALHLGADGPQIREVAKDDDRPFRLSGSVEEPRGIEAQGNGAPVGDGQIQFPQERTLLHLHERAGAGKEIEETSADRLVGRDSQGGLALLVDHADPSIAIRHQEAASHMGDDIFEQLPAPIDLHCLGLNLVLQLLEELSIFYQKVVPLEGAASGVDQIVRLEGFLEEVVRAGLE